MKMSGHTKESDRRICEEVPKGQKLEDLRRKYVSNPRRFDSSITRSHILVITVPGSLNAQNLEFIYSMPGRALNIVGRRPAHPHKTGRSCRVKGLRAVTINLSKYEMDAIGCVLTICFRHLIPIGTGVDHLRVEVSSDLRHLRPLCGGDPSLLERKASLLLYPD